MTTDLTHVPADRLRVSAYFDDNGRCTNIDVITNDVRTIPEIESIVIGLAKAVRPAPTTSFSSESVLGDISTPRNGRY